MAERADRGTKTGRPGVCWLRGAVAAGLFVGSAAWGQAGPPPVRVTETPPAETERAVPEPVTDDAGVTTSWVAAGGATLRVRTMGEGDPVLVLTGGPGFAGEQLFSTAAAIAKTHRAILPDQRGTGESKLDPFDPTQFSIDLAVADLERIRVAMGLEKWSLVGHSWGGLLSMAYAAAHPERVSAMALVSPAGIDSSFWTSYQRNLSERMDPETRAELGKLTPAAQTPQAMRVFMRDYNRAMAPAMVASEGAVEALRAEMTPERFEPLVSMALQRYLGRYDFAPKLSSFAGRVLVVQGDQDAIGPEVGLRIVDTIPDAERKVIENCGHWPFLERPETLNAMLSEFLGA